MQAIRIRCRRTAAMAIVALTVARFPGDASAENWPCFRGPSGLGITTEPDLPLSWGGSDRENLLWEAPLVGSGHASPVVWEGRVFVCTARWPESVEDRKKVRPEHHVLCYRACDGEKLWDVLIPQGPWLRDDFRSGPGGGYAAPTPATDGRLLFCAFGSSVVVALDPEGRVVWRREIVPFTFDVTLGSSPVLFGDTVILLCAMARPEDSRVIAWRKGTGEVAWETKLPSTGFGHSTPLLIDVDGKPQMLILASGASVVPDALQALDPRSGERLWWCRGSGDAASPAYGSGVVYFDSGRWGPGVAVVAGGSGDVTGSRVRWTQDEVPEAIGSPAIVGGHVYRLHAPGVLKCWSLETGKTVYAERLSGITTTWASPIVAPEGRIYFASAGKSFVIETGPRFRLLATSDLGDPNHASPAISEGRIFLVGQRMIHAVGKR